MDTAIDWSNCLVLPIFRIKARSHVAVSVVWGSFKLGVLLNAV